MTSVSPPTVRVVQIIGILSTATQPKSVSEIAAGTGISRATATAIVNELHGAGWLSRDAGLRYRIGPEFPRIENAALPPAFHAVLAGIADAAGCGATVSRIAPDRLTVVDKAQSGARAVAGFAVGQTIPLAFPAGSGVMPWRSAAERKQWLATAPRSAQRMGRQLLQQVSDSGFVMYRPEERDAGLVDLLADLLGSVGAAVVEPQLRDRMLRQLGRLTSRPYTPEELRCAAELPISYLAAPVFGDGEARYELQLGPLLSAVSRAGRDALVECLTHGAAELSRVLQAASSAR